MYDYVQFLHFAPYTDSYTEAAFTEKQLQRSSLLPKDLDLRLDQVEQMLDLALPYARADKKDTLKVFLMPEWSFGIQDKAKKDEDGYYTRKQMQRVHDAFIALSAQPRFADFLFVPGSVCWAPPGKPPRQVYNTVFVFHQGKLVHKYHKQNNAGDAAPGDQMPLDMQEKSDRNLQWLADPVGVGYTPKSGALPSLFTFDDRQFGVEVCADHARSVVLREYIHREQYSMQVEGIDVHLIVGCGTVGLQRNSVAAKPGGYAVLCEGTPRNAKNNEILQVTYQMSQRGTKELLPRVQNYDTARDEDQRTVQWLECQKTVVGDPDALAHRLWVTGRLRLPP